MEGCFCVCCVGGQSRCDKWLLSHIYKSHNTTSFFDTRTEDMHRTNPCAFKTKLWRRKISKCIYGVLISRNKIRQMQILRHLLCIFGLN